MKKMKPATRSLLITVVLLVILAAAAAILLKPEASSDDPGNTGSVSSSASGSTVSVISKNMALVKSVEVENSNGTFTIETYTPSGAEAPSFHVKEMEGIATSSSALQEVARHAYMLVATLDLGTTDEVLALSEYGLDKPAAKLKATFSDGTPDFEMSVGNRASSGYYVLANGHVYMASISESVFMDKFAFIEASLFTVQVRGDGSDVINYLKLSGTHYPDGLEMSFIGELNTKEYNGLLMPYIISKPFVSGVNSARIDELVQALYAPKAFGTAGYKPDEATLAEMGLDDPYVVCEFALNGDKHVLRLGNEHETGYRYLMVDENPVVFVVETSTVAAWAELTDQSLRDGFVWSPLLKKTGGLTISAEGKTWKYEIARTEESTASNGTVNYTYTAKLNGKEADYEAFRSVYIAAISPLVISSEMRETEETPILTLEYTYYDGGTTRVTFYAVKDGERRCAAYVGSSFVGMVKDSVVTDILSTLP